MNRKVLMIAPSYPPCDSFYGTISSLRIAKFAKYLPQYRWDPIVVTRSSGPNEGITEEEATGKIKVIRTSCKKHRFLHEVDQRVMGDAEHSSGWAQSAIRREAVFWFNEIFCYPDKVYRWKSSSLEAARKILTDEKISILFSSCLPPTSHLIANQLQNETGIPWVAEYRDLWTHNQYSRHTVFRKVMEKRLEKKVIKNAESLVTVSVPLAERLKALHNKPVEVITNGFDECDYQRVLKPTPYFSITYTGQIYERKMDPAFLFAAVRKLLSERRIDKEKFKIRFYGPSKDIPKVLSLAKKHNVSEVVRHYGTISYGDTVLRQQESSVLLLLNWADVREKGVYTGKVFEYLGAGRPILAIPKNEGSVVEKLLNETASGISSSNLKELCHILTRWYEEFLETGGVAYQGQREPVLRYTRKAQTEKLASVFDESIGWQ